MITLLQFPSSWPEMPNPSPFCTKVEVFLRMAGLDYQLAPWSPTRAPLGKAPVIEVDGELVPDSSRIIAHLIQRFDLDIDAHLSTDDHARGHLVKRAMEEHAYWGLLFARWVEPAGWAAYAPIIGESIPALARPLLLPWLRRGVRNSCQAHGLCRHDRAEVTRRVLADVDATAAVLGSNDFLLGDRPSSYDATAWSFLAHLSVDVAPHPIVEGVRANDRVMAYVERGREAWGQPRA